MLVFTNHAKKRMRERGVSKRQIVATLRQPKLIRKEDGSITIFSQKFGSNTLEVVAEVDNAKVIIITLYWI